MSGTAVLAYSDIGSHSFELEDTQGSASASPIGQRGTRYVRPVEPLGGAAPLRFCDRVCSRSAGAVATERRIVRARLGPRLPPPPSLRPTAAGLVPRPSSLVSSAGSSSESDAKAACEDEHVSRPRPRPPYVPQRISGLPRPNSSPESAAKASTERAASRPRPPYVASPRIRPASLLLTASHRITASGLPRLERRVELGVGWQRGVRARASSVPPTPSVRRAAPIPPVEPC
ncbi:hypothetical protein B0H15DRAFT_955862 [Mycena belliarum]|uniref:Uncharacterized protein n=1 Tax=Mycena belliarum TaxID=1033014 RepID=A0AAD6XI36_9AGAR|nr:hypothetical protein B0H15DRAFT_955862 [Mycena belliae]